MGDDAVFHALRAEPLEATHLQPESLIETFEAGWDLGSDLNDTSIDDRLEDQEPQLEAWRALREALLASDACPWWGRHCDARDVQGGALAPEALGKLVSRVRETGALGALADALDADDMPNGYRELNEFLERAAAAGAWVLWRSR